MSNSPLPVTKRWTVHIGGTEYPHVSIDFEKIHPSPDPDVFTIVLSGKKSISFFSPVQIKKDGVLRFYGYVEEIGYEAGDVGVNTIIGGRCRKVILWKKWTERFVDGRGTIKGFFGKVYPHELIKFFLRNPISQIPEEGEETWDDYPRQKIGWGIRSDDWGCEANVTAEGTHTMYPRLRLVGFYWKNRGDPQTIQTRLPDGSDASGTWNENGAVGAGCINTDDGDTTTISSGTNNQVSNQFSFANLDAGAASIEKVKLFVKLRCDMHFPWHGWWEANIMTVLVEVYDGTIWTQLAYIRFYHLGYYEHELNATYFLDTVAKFNAVKVRFTMWDNDGGNTAYITYVHFKVVYSIGGSQETNDYFQVNLGETYNRVSGIIIQSRHASDQYPADYRLETATQDFQGVIGNDSIEGLGTPVFTSIGSAGASNDMYIAGGCANFNNGTGGAVSISRVRAYLNIHADDDKKVMHAVIYRDLGTGVNNFQLLGTSDAYNVPSGTGWREFVFSTPVSVQDGWDIYFGILACNFAQTWGLLTYGAGVPVSADIVPNSFDLVHQDFSHANCVHDCLRYDDGDTKYIQSEDMGGAVGEYDEEYSFTNLPAYDFIAVSQARLYAKGKVVNTADPLADSVTLRFYLKVNGAWNNAGTLCFYQNAYHYGNTLCGGAGTGYLDVSGILDTIDKIQDVRMKIEVSGKGSMNDQRIHLTYVKIHIEGTEGGNCNTNDYETNGLGACTAPNPHGAPDVSDTAYDVIYGLYGGDWTVQATVSDNCAQDIIHSWSPCQAKYIKIVLTGQDSTHGWEITQIYVYEADEADYTVYESTKSPNIVVNESDIEDYENSDKSCAVIEPFNIPFSRLNEALERVCKAAYDTNYTPYEWWIEDEEEGEDDGRVRFAPRRGTDKSADVKFEYGEHFSYAKKDKDVKKTVQRLRVVGQGEGRRQDEISSDWKKNTDAMDEINTFYEEIISDKSLAYKESTNAWAEVHLKEKKDKIEEIEVIIERDTHASGSWDVGDDITLSHSLVDITEQDYRIKRVHVTVDDSGETIVLTVTNSWEDITDRIASLLRKIRDLELSSSYVDEWTAEGTSQRKVSQDEIENIWQMERKYEEADEFQDVASDDQETYTTLPADFAQINGREAVVAKDELSLYGLTATAAGQDTVCYVKNRDTDLDRDPRFLVKLMITGAFKVVGANKDYVDFFIAEVDEGGTELPTNNWFGFRIQYDGVSYNVYAVLKDLGSTGYWSRLIATINVDTMYEFEAKVDWNDKMVFYYMDGIAKAVIPFNAGATLGNTMRPMVCHLRSSQPESASGQAIVEFFTWRTQSKKESEVEHK